MDGWGWGGQLVAVVMSKGGRGGPPIWNKAKARARAILSRACPCPSRLRREFLAVLWHPASFPQPASVLVFLTRHKTCDSIKNTCVLFQSMVRDSHWHSVNTPSTSGTCSLACKSQFWALYFYKGTRALLVGINFQIIFWASLRRLSSLLENNISQREDRRSVGQNFEEWGTGRKEGQGTGVERWNLRVGRLGQLPALLPGNMCQRTVPIGGRVLLRHCMDWMFVSPAHSCVEALTPTVLVFGGGACER